MVSIHDEGRLRMSLSSEKRRRVSDAIQQSLLVGLPLSAAYSAGQYPSPFVPTLPERSAAAGSSPWGEKEIEKGFEAVSP